MRVLIACECSGKVRQAFRDRGHDAWSCDLQPADDEQWGTAPLDLVTQMEAA